MRQHRREFLAATASIGLGVSAAARLGATPEEKTFKISLAQWSFHRALQAKTPPKMDPLDFAKVAKTQFDIDAIEYVNQFYKDSIKQPTLAKELKHRADDHCVTSVLIMCDGEGDLGDPDNAKRQKAVDNHKKWLELGKALGCHSIRVNAASDKKLSPEEQAKLAIDGLRRLCEVGDTFGLNVIVENHGGLSSNGQWLAGVIKGTGHKRAGTLPDFGNFYEYDRYQGVKDLMPFAKGVSAKSHQFDAQGNETKTDYKRMMKIVMDAGYHGYVGIEYEGDKHSEPDGVRLTKKLLERIRSSLTA